MSDLLIKALRTMAGEEGWLHPEVTLYGQAADEIERLRERFEELEKQQDIHCQTIAGLVCEDSHVRITTDKINEAWELANDPLLNSIDRAYHRMILAQLGIVDNGRGGWRMSDEI
jgi:hypothetical protein